MRDKPKKKEEATKNISRLHEDVMARIAVQKVEPRPKWYFSLKNFLLWGTGLLLLLVGALSVSIIIFMVSGNTWEMRRVIGNSPIEHVVQIFPFLWLIAFVTFLITSDYIITHTKGTYKHSSLKVSLVIIAISIILGSIFYFCKISSFADEVLGKKAPHLYKTLDQRRDGMLHRPEKGRIMGIVQSVDGRTFVIMDKRKTNKLLIDGQDIPQEKYMLVETGSSLLIIGKPQSKEVFKAFDVHPAAPKMRRMLRQIETINHHSEAIIMK